MGSRRSNILIVSFVLVLLALSGWAIVAKDFKLGIDLEGGTQLVYEAKAGPGQDETTGEAIDRAIEVMRDRVDAFGVAEPEISRLGPEGIQVNLPNVQDAQRAQEQVGRTAQMFFYDFEPNVVPTVEGTSVVNAGNREQQSRPRLYDAVQIASEEEPECRDDSCTRIGPAFYGFDRETKELIAGPTDQRVDLLESSDFLESGLTREELEIVAVPQGTIVVKEPLTDSEGNELAGERWYVMKDRPALSGDQITDPAASRDRLNQPIVTFDFTDGGADTFQEVTRDIAVRGQTALPPAPESFAIILDGEIISRPVIDFNENPNGIDGGQGAQISGSFTIQEVSDLAELLRIGALPVELELISQSTISATLGEQALNDAVLAGLIGLILVMLFLIVYYRFLGVVATLGILVYAVFYMALIKVIPITLTLPGIAGLILTIGVAADSNIVIFERIKEEARAGHSMLSAITVGYRKGIATIIDANVITLLTAFILFGLATSGVKGFAFTLGVGVVVSLFTAVVFTRAVLGLMGRSKLLTDPKYAGAGEQKVKWHYDFAGASKYFFSASGAILAIGAIAFSTAQLNFGIDFESGTRIRAALAEPVDVEAVRDSLSTAGVENPDAAKIQEVGDEAFGDNIVQIDGKIETDQVGTIQTQLEEDFGFQLGEDDQNRGGFESQSVGPTFGEQVAKSAAYAILFSLLLISAYVAFRFEAKYAIPVLIAVIHDILITAGIYSISDREVTSATVAAFLTILGYSLYDCVIVFDRVRENVPRLPRATFAQIANRSLSEVLTRSLITGLSTVFLISVILVFGGDTLSDFAFAMMIGLLSGTYSSIFIATPVLIAWKERESGYRARAARIKEAMGYVPAFPEDNRVAKLEGEKDELSDAEIKAMEKADEVDDDAVAIDSDYDPSEDFDDDEDDGEDGPDDDSDDAEQPEPEPEAEELTPEQQAERDRKREVRAQRKARAEARKRKHGRPR